MLNHATNPPQFLSAGPSANKLLASPLDVITASVRPIENDTGHDLLNALCCMREANDLVGMLDLYDAYSRSAETLMFAGDRSDGVAAGMLHEAGAHAWSRAYLVADFLKEMRPSKYMVERHCQALFNVALQMGGTLDEVSAVVAEIASWELDTTHPPSMVQA